MMQRAALIALAAALWTADSSAQSKNSKQDAIIADMQAMLEFMCLKANPDEADRARCVSEQSAALKETVRLITVPDPIARTRNNRLFDLCTNDNRTPHGIDLAASLACIRKF